MTSDVFHSHTHSYHASTLNHTPSLLAISILIAPPAAWTRVLIHKVGTSVQTHTASHEVGTLMPFIHTDIHTCSEIDALTATHM